MTLARINDLRHDGRNAASTVSGEYPAGRFATTVTNALNQSETHGYDRRFGTARTHTGPNGIAPTWEVDSLGRVMKEKRADGDGILGRPGP